MFLWSRLALDDIAYLKPEGRTGPTIFDTVLFPVHHDHELELELKTLTDGQEVREVDLAKFMAWAAPIIGDNADDVEISTVSKAIRAHEAVYGQKEEPAPVIT